MSKRSAVRVCTKELVLPTYLPAAPDQNPMFLEKRVYQGSTGKVYPLPFTDRIAEKPVDRKWKAIRIENEFLRVLVLPELGGRIHAILDKTNGYDLIYNQPVIKPALVGLAGPWASGGIEFNWPQHHRPATFLPVDFKIEKHPDGAITVWCSDHDPMTRMKGMHGVCLHPDKAYIQLRVRAYNRTPLAQTFLWWANVATRVHESYQSFFPPDVYYVADHARRSTSEYPLAQGDYYGVNYGKRGRQGVPASEVPGRFVPPHCRPESDAECSRLNVPNYSPNDLSFYANIPVPTSYMCMGSQEDFFGGYDHAAQAGIVHIANHHISPGKKQWTWGNQEFGYAWDRNLTDKDDQGEFSPYIEIMAGVYTDNQPDFSFLQPGETKSWSQYWYPIQKMGPAQHANLDAAISLRVLDGGGRRSTMPLLKGAAPRRSAGAVEHVAKFGVSVTQRIFQARILLTARGKKLFTAIRDLVPGKPFVTQIKLARGVTETDLQLHVLASDGNEIISYQPKPRARRKVPLPATEPAPPAAIASSDELFITGQHLAQYRHATRCPTLCWREALRRDAMDSRCNNAMGLWHLKRGEFAEAEKYFRTAIARLTKRNANPADGEPYYNLGLCLRFQFDRSSRGDEAHLSSQQPAGGNRQSGQSRLMSAATRLFDDAYAAFYKATWNQAWAGASYHALAEMDCCRQDWPTALEHLDRSLRFDTDNLRARNLRAVVLRKLGLDLDAATLLRTTLALDPLDVWTRQLHGEELTGDLQSQLDLAHDYAHAGLFAEAIHVLKTARANRDDLPDQSWGAWPMVNYTLGWLEQKRGDAKKALKLFKSAAALGPDYCFPARLEEIAVLQAAMAANPHDARAPYYLGNLLYDRRRHAEAIKLWERSAKLDPDFSIVWRNLGIGYFNIRHQPAKARAAYERAFAANPADARLLYERDQLWKRLGENPPRRLRELAKRLDLVQQRDDLSVELSALYNQTGQPTRALAVVSSRKFQPWEGGEGGPLGQWIRSHLLLGSQALNGGDGPNARKHFEAALIAPENLGEAKHLLANQSDIHYRLGCALDALGEKSSARQHWLTAATARGDFQAMSVRMFSELTYYSARAYERLGQKAKSRKLFRELLAYAQKLRKSEAKIDYFATSLPTMLIFDDDLQYRQETTALFLHAQAELGLGRRARAQVLLKAVLKRDPSHALAVDLAAAQTGRKT
jgi:tetratricopeptide (TPR) repeat protein